MLRTATSATNFSRCQLSLISYMYMHIHCLALRMACPAVADEPSILFYVSRLVCRSHVLISEMVTDTRCSMAPTAVSPSWSVLCWNLSALSHSAIIQGVNSSRRTHQWRPVAVSVNDTASQGDEDATTMDDRDRHALLYIVVVLLFYSTGIVVAIVTYLKREKADIEEEKAYEDYVRFDSG